MFLVGSVVSQGLLGGSIVSCSSFCDTVCFWGIAVCLMLLNFFFLLLPPRSVWMFRVSCVGGFALIVVAGPVGFHMDSPVFFINEICSF